MVPRKARSQSSTGKGQQGTSNLSQHALEDEPVQEAEAATVVPEVVEELTEEELVDRQHLELKVERAFVEAGKALRELRDRRLYRDIYRTFEVYCRVRFGFTYRYGNQLIAGSLVIENLETVKNRSQNQSEQMGTIRSQILPTKLEQVKPLTSIEPEEQWKIWQQAVETAGGKVPSGRIVKGIVERLKEKPLSQLSITYKRGDTFTLRGLTGAERRYNGCWAIAREILEFSLKVETHDAMLLVKPDNLQPIDDREVRRQLPALLKRIKRLQKRELDRGALAVLESLGKQTYLTEVEEGLLSWLENFYGVG